MNLNRIRSGWAKISSLIERVENAKEQELSNKKIWGYYRITPMIILVAGFYGHVTFGTLVALGAFLGMMLARGGNYRLSYFGQLFTTCMISWVVGTSSLLLFVGYLFAGHKMVEWIRSHHHVVVTLKYIGAVVAAFQVIGVVLGLSVAFIA